MDSALRVSLLAFAACLPITIALAQLFAFLSLLLWLVLRFRRSSRKLSSPNPLALPILLFIGWALLASAWGERPATSFGRSHRLLIYLLPLAIPFAAQRAPGGSTAFVSRLIRAFLFGAFLLGLYDVVRIPLQASRGAWLYGLGNMRDPQFHMTALLLLLTETPSLRSGLCFPPDVKKSGGKRRAAGVPIDRCIRGKWEYAVRIAVAGGGLLLHFKRGAWFSFLAALAVPVLAFRRWRSLLAAGIILSVLLCFPPVQQRIEDLTWEWSGRRGGRRDLWTQIAPAMIHAHPLGFGPRAVRHQDLRAYRAPNRPPEGGLSHLHNNVLQIAVEFGWPGLAGWTAWMGLGFLLLLQTLRRASPGTRERPLSAGLLAAYTALHLNGLVEYNFGDSEILMLFMLLLGLAVSLGGKKNPLPISPAPPDTEYAQNGKPERTGARENEKRG